MSLPESNDKKKADPMTQCCGFNLDIENESTVEEVRTCKACGATWTMDGKEEIKAQATEVFNRIQGEA